MAGRVYDLLVRARGETGDAQRAMKDLQSSVKGAGQKMTSVGRDMTKYVTLPVLAAAGASVKLASDAGETANKLETLLGTGTKRVTKDLDAFAKATGSSVYTLREQAATIAALLTPMKLGAQATEDMTVNVVQLAKDLSSFHNIAEDDALDKLRAGLTGEAEPLKALGILINETSVKQEAYNSGIAKTGATLTEQQKVQARYNLILQQSDKAQGDATRTADSFSNQMKATQNSVKDIGVTIGTELMPMATQLLGAVSSGVHWFASLDQAMQATIVTAALTAAAIGPLLIVVGQMAQGAAVLAPALIRVTGALRAAGVAAGISAAAMGPLVIATVAVTVAAGALILREREKADAFRKTSEAARKQIEEFGSVADAERRLAGAALSVKEANLAVTQAQQALTAARKAGDPTAITQATLALERAKLSQADAVANNTKVQQDENAAIGQAAQVANIALQKLRDEATVRQALADVRKKIAQDPTQAVAKGYTQEADQLAAHLGRLKNAHGSSLEAVKAAYKSGLISRQQVVAAGLAEEVGIVVRKAPAMKAAGKRVGDAAAAGARSSQGAAREAGRSLGDGIQSGFLSTSGSMLSASRQYILNAIAAGKQAAEAKSPSRATAREIGRPMGQGIAVGIRSESKNIAAATRSVVAAAVAAGAAGVAGTKFSALGDLSNSTKLTGNQAILQAQAFAVASSTDAYTVTTDDRGFASVRENTATTGLIRARIAANEARITQLNTQRNALIPKLTAANQAKARATAGTKAKMDAVALVNRLNGEIDALEQEILSLGGQVTQDKAALVAPDVSAQNAATQAGIDRDATAEAERVAAENQRAAQEAAAEAQRAADAQRDAERAAENLRREALGLSSLDEEEHLAAINAIRVKYGLPPVSSTSEIGGVSGGGSASEPTPPAADASAIFRRTQRAGDESALLLRLQQGLTQAQADELGANGAKIVFVNQNFTGEPDMFAASQTAAWAVQTAGLTN